MEVTKEIILAIIGVLTAAAITISIVINKNKNVNKYSVKQKGDNSQAYINSTVDNSKKVEKE
ncbi:hypothetical protein [Priestia endophytica]|uniref:hypothetical protein n=1 Tax=Priestia endophytica TaxID=135735 RepID=UPI000DCA7E2F|nr:hypothetical protein [Priestia endophytica]RAS82340.1 hypothetical protein A4R27_09105 [Priestia endophytica]